MSEELKPCPFCGGDADGGNYVIEGAVWCKKCRCTIIRKHTNKSYPGNGMEIAIRVWNTRKGDSNVSRT